MPSFQAYKPPHPEAAHASGLLPAHPHARFTRPCSTPPPLPPRSLTAIFPQPRSLPSPLLRRAHTAVRTTTSTEHCQCLLAPLRSIPMPLIGLPSVASSPGANHALCIENLPPSALMSFHRRSSRNSCCEAAARAAAAKVAAANAVAAKVAAAKIGAAKVGAAKVVAAKVGAAKVTDASFSAVKGEPPGIRFFCAQTAIMRSNFIMETSMSASMGMYRIAYMGKKQKAIA